jgi:hypothetical protein
LTEDEAVLALDSRGWHITSMSPHWICLRRGDDIVAGKHVWQAMDMANDVAKKTRERHKKYSFETPQHERNPNESTL